MRRIRGEKPRVRTCVLLPKPGAPAMGHYRPKEPKAGVLTRGHCKPTNVQRGYRRVGTVGFSRLSGAVFSDYRAFPPTSEERLEARNHGFGFASCSRGLVFPDGDMLAQIPARLLTLLPNTPQTEWCYSGSPYPISTVVPFVVCCGRRAIFLRGEVHDGRKDQAFRRPSSSGAHHVVA